MKNIKLGNLMLTENVDHSTDDILFNTRKPANEPKLKKEEDVAVI